MALNIITDNTKYITFQEYSKLDGSLVLTWDIPKVNITSIQTFPSLKKEDKLGVVIIQTITQLDASYKNSIIELSPLDWALSGTSTVPITDAATLRTALLSYLSGNYGVVTQFDLALKQPITDASFNTTSKTVPGAINELLTNSGIVGNEKAIYALGGNVKITLPIGSSAWGTTSADLVSQTIYWIAYYLPETRTITGAKWLQQTAGSYTANNYNGIGLYSFSGTTFTRITLTNDDGNIWKASSFTVGTKAFPVPQVLTSGVYYLAFMYSTSAPTTAPTIYGCAAMSVTTPAMVGGNIFTGTIATQTALPTPTQLLSGITATATAQLMWLY